MRYSLRQNWVGYTGAVLGVFAVTILSRIFAANSTTVALSFLLVVLFSASAYGLGAGIVASVLGVLCFNYFFLPPLGTFTIDSPQNWVALIAFLVTAGLASQLSSAARTRTKEAERRREEVWKLYQLSRAIIVMPDPDGAAGSIARCVKDIFKIHLCAIYTPVSPCGWNCISSTGGVGSDAFFKPRTEKIDEVFRTMDMMLPETMLPKGAHRVSTIWSKGVWSPDESSIFKPDDLGDTFAYIPLKVGVKPIGVIVLRAYKLDPGAMEAIAGLVALALERARFLKDLSRTEALRQSDELKSALLASVSHDLRTPLTSIRAAIDNLLQVDIEWDKTELQEFHLIISEEVNRLTRLIQNLLDMARIEAGELHLEKRWESVSEIISDVLDRCVTEVKNHHISVDLQGDMPLVMVDSRLISEVLTNLIENAVKYSPIGTGIMVSGCMEGTNLIYSVRDNGPGIPAEDIVRIFDKFYRGSRVEISRSKGTGMGLAIARGIVRAHGGEIWVESNPDSGSTFSFYIPVETKKAYAEPGSMDTIT